jgi:hypothetical protein
MPKDEVALLLQLEFGEEKRLEDEYNVTLAASPWTRNWSMTRILTGFETVDGLKGGHWRLSWRHLDSTAGSSNRVLIAFSTRIWLVRTSHRY